MAFTMDFGSLSLRLRTKTGGYSGAPPMRKSSSTQKAARRGRLILQTKFDSLPPFVLF